MSNERTLTDHERDCERRYEGIRAEIADTRKDLAALRTDVDWLKFQSKLLIGGVGSLVVVAFGAVVSAVAIWAVS